MILNCQKGMYIVHMMSISLYLNHFTRDVYRLKNLYRGISQQASFCITIPINMYLSRIIALSVSGCCCSGCI